MLMCARISLLIACLFLCAAVMVEAAAAAADAQPEAAVCDMWDDIIRGQVVRARACVR